jgi:ParB family chromosome partitioning protein
MKQKELPKRLGRGLATLMGDLPLGIQSSHPAVQSLQVSVLEPGSFQPRRMMDEAALDELADSLKSRGILQPLLVRPHPSAEGQYQIIAGERRWRAAQKAGLHEVPVLVRALSDTDAMAAGLVENLQRQDLNGIEEAEGFRRLIDEFGLTQEQLAQAIGKSRPHITNMLRLLGLPPDLQTYVRLGALSAGHARAILNHPKPADAARAIIAGQLSVRQAEALTQQALAPEDQPDRIPARAANPEAEVLASRLAQKLGLHVRISFDGKRGTVAIAYQSLDQLDGIIALLDAGGS